MGNNLRYRLLGLLAMLGLVMAIGTGAVAEARTGPVAPDGPAAYYCSPPRFQIYHAPGQFGGMLLVDSKTGVTYQRVIVATPNGIDIRWMKIEKFKTLGPNETIQWQ